MSYQACLFDTFDMTTASSSPQESSHEACAPGAQIHNSLVPGLPNLINFPLTENSLITFPALVVGAIDITSEAK